MLKRALMDDDIQKDDHRDGADDVVGVEGHRTGLVEQAVTIYRWIHGAFISAAYGRPSKTERSQMIKPLLLALPLLAASSVSADPKPAPVECPAAVKVAISHDFPKSSISTCKLEHDKDHDQFEVKIVKADGAKAEVDVTADGKILQVEEKIALDQVPSAVAKAFAARYPKAKFDVAEKQTPSHGAPSYELGFAVGGGRKEATFTSDGKFVEEE